MLVGDDDAVSRTLVAHALVRQGYVVVQAADGAAVLAAWERELFHAVLVDVYMPACDGPAVARAIRARERGRRVPIVALSATDAADDRGRCLAAGMGAFLAKPVDVLVLTRTLAAICGAPAPVDVEDVLARVRGDMALLRRMISLFREQSGSLLADGWRAIEHDDSRGLDAAAHALKGVVSHFSHGGAFAGAGAVEVLARAGDLARARAGWRDLERDVRELDAALDDLDASRSR